MHRSEISRLERGERMPRIDTAIKLAGVLDVPVVDLLEGIEWMQDGTQDGARAPIEEGWEAGKQTEDLDQGRRAHPPGLALNGAGTQSPVSVAEQFGKNLRRCRKGRGLSRSELGRRAGLDATGVGTLERGGQRPRIDTAVKLAGALAVPACELLRGIEWKPAGTEPGEFAPLDQVEMACRHAEDFGADLRTGLWDLDGEEIF